MAGACELAPLSLYVAALAGETLGLRWHDEPGGRTYWDGAVLAIAAARRDACRIDAALQALLVRQRSFHPHALQRLIGRSRLSRGYLACELARAVHAAGDLLPRAVLEHDSLRLLPPPTTSREQSLARAGSLALDTTPAAWGVLMPFKILARQAPGARAASAADEEELSARGATRRRPLDRELEDSRILDAFRAPAGGAAGPLGRLLGSLFDRRPAERTRAGGGAAADSEPREGQWLGPRSTPRAISGRVRLAAAAAPPSSSAEVTYPEWDEQRGVYRADHVRVAEVEPAADVTLAQQVPGPSSTRRLRRSLARVALDHERRRHQPHGDDIDIDALVRLHADLRGGHAADAAIHVGTTRTKRDLSVLLLLDITASTAEPAAAGGRVFDQQLGFALALARALHASGDQVGIYGFHSWGPKIVRMVRLLDLGDAPDARMRQRAGRVAPAGYSRLGAAVRHGARILGRRGVTSRRALLVVSDAVAYDQGYEGRYAQADTRRALAEARGANIACLCLSVGASTERSELEQVFGGACFLALPRVDGHEPALRALFEQALAQVNRRRGAITPAQRVTRARAGGG